MATIKESDVIRESDIFFEDGRIVSVCGIKVGETVMKRSGKPFKCGSTKNIVERFEINPQCPRNERRPLNCMGAFLKESQTHVCVTAICNGKVKWPPR